VPQSHLSHAHNANTDLTHFPAPPCIFPRQVTLLCFLVDYNPLDKKIWSRIAFCVKFQASVSLQHFLLDFEYRLTI
jgi:hypothetical protein